MPKRKPDKEFLFAGDDAEDEDDAEGNPDKEVFCLASCS